MQTKRLYINRAFGVITVIALLLVLLLSAVQRINRQAGTVGCRSNLYQGLYFSLNTDDNNGYLHRGWNDCTHSQDSGMVVKCPYYLDNPDLRFCPMSTKSRNKGADSTFGAYRHKKNYYQWIALTRLIVL